MQLRQPPCWHYACIYIYDRELHQRWLGDHYPACSWPDDTGIEFDQQHLLTPAGGPMHYAMRGFDADHCRQLIKVTRAKSRYFTLLNAMHLLFLYGKDNSQAALTLTDELKELVATLRRELHVSGPEADNTYAHMQFTSTTDFMRAMAGAEIKENVYTLTLARRRGKANT